MTQPRNGWITVYDEACDRDPADAPAAGEGALRADGAVVIAIGVEHEQVVRFVLLEAGRVVDEYLSVPEHYGPLPPGDAIALAANPRVVARLTGADPAAVRAPPRTAASPDRAAAGAGAARVDRGGDRARGAERGWEELVITLYDAARCPYCARVRIVLAEKGIPYETVEIDLRDRPAWLYDLNPVGKVPGARRGRLDPARVGGDRRVPERALSRPPLWPDDPGERAAGRLLVFRFEDFSKPYYALRRGEEGARQRFEEELAASTRCSPGCPG